MIITKMALPRRTFLRGVGAAVALPLLDAMVPALSAASQTAAAPVRRLGFVYIPNGAIMDQWTPAAEGKGFELSPILKPLEAHRDRITVVSNLDSRPAEAAQGEGSGDHARGERRLAVAASIRSAPRAPTCAAARPSIRSPPTCSAATPSFARWRWPRKTSRPWAAATSATPAAT